MIDEILLVSLNNPREFFYTRHNAGAWWLKYFCLINNMFLFMDSFSNLYYYKIITFKGKRLHIVEPNVYMNNCGKVIYNYICKYAIFFKNIIIIHDDLDLNSGIIKLSYKVDNFCHNGIKNVVEFLKINSFYRLRIGIGKSEYNQNMSDYVLGVPSRKEFEFYFRCIKNSFLYIDDILNFSFSDF